MRAPEGSGEAASNAKPASAASTWLGRIARESFGVIGVGILTGGALFLLAGLAPPGAGSAVGFVVFALALTTLVPTTILGIVWLFTGIVATPPRYRRAEVSASSWIGVRLVHLAVAVIIVLAAAIVSSTTWANPILVPPVVFAMLFHGAIAWWIVALSARSLRPRLRQHPIAEMFKQTGEQTPEHP